MKKIYFIVDEGGYKYTAMMYSNRKAAEVELQFRQKREPNKKFHIDFGYMFSH